MKGARGLLGILACVLLVSGCATTPSSYAGNSGGDAPAPIPTAEPVDCPTLVDTVIERQRLGDTAGAINAELDVLGDQCPHEYSVFVDYASIMVMSRVVPGGPCPDPGEFNVEPEAVELARRDGLCTDPSPEPAPEPSWEPIPGPSEADPGLSHWTCTYQPTYNYDWHDDVVCSNGSEAHRPYLREWDEYVTEDEIMESAREYEDQLNGA